MDNLSLDTIHRIEKEIIIMELVDKKVLYNKAVELENQAYRELKKCSNNKDNFNWRIWNAVLIERVSFKYDIADAPSFDDNDLLKISAQIILDKLKECPLFCGHYDHKNGNDHFMHGVSTVMEVIANYAEDYDFEEMFLENMGEE